MAVDRMTSMSFHVAYTILVPAFSFVREFKARVIFRLRAEQSRQRVPGLTEQMFSVNAEIVEISWKERRLSDGNIASSS